MVANQNSFLTKRIVDLAKLPQAMGNIPKEIMERILPVIVINDNIFYGNREQVIRDATALNATSATIYATDPNKEFYLQSAELTVSKDAVATSTESVITAVIDGSSREILHIDGQTLTADRQSVAINFNYPIRIDRATNISITNTTAVATIKATGVIYGFLQQYEST